LTEKEEILLQSNQAKDVGVEELVTDGQ